MPVPSNLELEPTESERRRFTLLDSMIMIAAIGLMLIVPRAFRALNSAGDEIFRFSRSIHSWMRMAEAIMILASATFVVLLLAPPGLSGKGRFRKPGAIALLAVILTWLFEFLQNGLIVVDDLRNNSVADFWAFNLVITPIRLTGSNAIFTILGSWLTLKIFGQFKLGQDWLDRCSFLLGSLWILWGLSQVFLARNFA